MDPQNRLEERAAIISDIVEGLQDVAVSETPTEDRSDTTSGSDSSDSEQPHEERAWINNTPRWSPPAEFALHSGNHLSTPEWKRACGILNVVVAKAEMTNTPIDDESFEPQLPFTSLIIKPRKKDLRKLKHAIQQPLQPPYLGEFSFDCSAVKTKKDVADLGKCREPIVDILKILYAQGHNDTVPVHPLRDALILLLEAFLCAIEMKQEVWFSWNGDDPKITERPFGMAASCCLTYAGIGDFGQHIPRFQAWFDYGLDIGSFTVSESGEKTVQESWFCCFEDEVEFGRMMINGWPGSKRPYLDYNLAAFETLMQCTDLRRIEIRNTRVHLGALLSLLNRNRHTLDILILDTVEANEDINA
ncbi:hypothetical protein KCU81_g7349, partial [Aureobasidium melanogenum]|uniref:Uncharacterized protein n=1 Tax=Aureobasidium melanogenum (strain CBS 110374) TaxID=1043003 RepID=A0A074WU64_AURM1